MEIFSYMKNIWFGDVEEFMQSVDKHRDEMLFADERLLYSDEYIVDIDAINKLPNGRIRSFYKGYQFDSFIYKKPSKYLYVILNGALTGRKPQFNRWSYYSFLDGSVLDIADPMYEKYKGLELGWYYGNNEENLRVYLAEYIRKISEYLHVKCTDIIVWGSSGGGAAALECVNYLEGAIGVAINPQILLGDYSYANKFEEITRIKLGMDHWHRADGIYHLKQGRHILLMNLRSKSDMVQMKKICESMRIRLQYGLNVFHNFIVWLYDCDLGNYSSPHNLQENYCVCFLIEWLIHHFEDIKELQNTGSLFRFANEFWSYRYRLELEWRNRKPNFVQIKECIEKHRKTAVWGCGKIGNQICEDILDVERSNYLNVVLMIDSNELLKGRNFHGIRITVPESVMDWKAFFIIVAVERGKSEIDSFLKNKGLIYKEDYIFYNDLYSHVKWRKR